VKGSAREEGPLKGFVCLFDVDDFVEDCIANVLCFSNQLCSPLKGKGSAALGAKIVLSHLFVDREEHECQDHSELVMLATLVYDGVEGRDERHQGRGGREGYIFAFVILFEEVFDTREEGIKDGRVVGI
jgi:hypothetical protein